MSQGIDYRDYRARNVGADSSAKAHETLDPMDWKSFRKQAHHMLDDMLDYTEHIRERPVWQPIPDEVRARFRGVVPRLPSDLAAVHEEFMRHILPFAAGNVHPGFMGWVHGGGTPVGMLAEMLAGGLNANLGGRDQAPIEVERQVVQWTREIFGFPQSATGLFVTGTSMANLIAVVVARDVALGFEVRRSGVGEDMRRLTAYASTAIHGCIGKALDLCGVGSDALRLIPTDHRHRIDLQALGMAIQKDRDAGLTPFLVVGSAGTVDTGAIDDLAGIADLCRRENIWFHVDGAYGALAIVARDLAPRLDGIERADSLAFDFHKWGQVPYDAGYILVRDGVLHRNTFATSAAYLKRVERGLAAGSPWPSDFGPDLSRGFRALKTWFTLKVYGTDALGAVISRTCELARYLESRITGTPELELLAPVELNIVCFRYRAEDSDRVNEKLVIDLQESGRVAPSTTTIGTRLAIRVAIVNHRTSRAEIDALVDSTLSLGRAFQNSATACKATQTAQENHAPNAFEITIADRGETVGSSTRLSRTALSAG
jgi:glutamate/tyrosine decarboxylase-like PLP-dependent enzyme